MASCGYFRQTIMAIYNNKHSKYLLGDVLALASASLTFLFSVPFPTTVIAFWYCKVGKFRFFLFLPFFLIWSFYYSFSFIFFSIPPDCKRLFKHETKIEQYILDYVVCSRIPFFEIFRDCLLFCFVLIFNFFRYDNVWYSKWIFRNDYDKFVFF